MTTAAAGGNAGGYAASMTHSASLALILGLALVGLAGFANRAGASDAEIDDIATRIDYGYYAGAPELVAAAERQLERLPADDERVRYLSALAAFRRAQLTLAARADAGTEVGTDAGDLLEHCIELVQPDEARERDTPIRVTRLRDAAAAEAWTLTAACAALAADVEPLRAAAHGRRRDNALERARAADPSNPRIALVAAWTLSFRPAAAGDETRAAAAAALEAAVGAFALAPHSERSADAPAPEWGEAEALTLLAELRARDGAQREARDLVERALLIAPDYAFAEALERAARGTD